MRQVSWNVSLVASDDGPLLSVVWDPESILCSLGTQDSPTSERLMVSQLTSSHEAISPPVLITEASALVPVSLPPCEIISVRLAQLDQGDDVDQRLQQQKSFKLVNKV